MRKQLKPRKTPTFKQSLFAKEYVKNKGNATQAALKVYDADYKNAHTIAMQNIQKPIVQEEIKKEMAKAGLNYETSSNYLKEAIEQGIKSGKATVDTSLRALDMFFKLSNAYPDKIKKSISYSIRDQVVSKNYSETQQFLEHQIKLGQKVIEES